MARLRSRSRNSALAELASAKAWVKSTAKEGTGPEIVELARTELYDLIVLPLPAESSNDPLGHLDERGQYIVRHAHCRVMLVTSPVIPAEVVDRTPSTAGR